MRRSPGSRQAADWCEAIILADYDEARARRLADSLGDADRFPAIQIDARDAANVTEAAEPIERTS